MPCEHLEAALRQMMKLATDLEDQIKDGSPWAGVLQQEKADQVHNAARQALAAQQRPVALVVIEVEGGLVQETYVVGTEADAECLVVDFDAAESGAFASQVEEVEEFLARIDKASGGAECLRRWLQLVEKTGLDEED